MTHKFPKIIYILWLQGRENAPELVRINFERWQRLNPDYQVVILDEESSRPYLADFPIDAYKLTPQSFSDVLRVRLLAETGGVWADASVYPMTPLSKFLEPRMAKSTFFAYGRNNPIQPVDSWFLAAHKDCFFIKKWDDMIKRYWFMEREAIDEYPDTEALPSFYVPKDVETEMGLADMTPTPRYPYFWVHHLFAYLLRVDVDFSAQWDAIEDNDFFNSFMIDRLHSNCCPVSLDIYINRLWWGTHKKLFNRFEKLFTRWLLSRADVHKLNWRRKTYPLKMLKNFR
ncbi:MAG: capsular polysaccharide synthesis protein [Candidatus Azotimanducaceae bacterium WSBS_2022_MAG_OTU7]